MAGHHGDFIWYELMSPDPAASEAFYGPVLGWTFGGGDEYRMITASEGEVGGILPLTADMAAGGAQPGWLGYVSVDDVDKMAPSVVEGGGKVYVPPRDIPGVGRFAMVADPAGAPFYIMTPTPPADRPEAESTAFSYDRPRLGHCAWNELATDDPQGALHFYGQRFGWVKDGEMDMGPLGAYHFIRHAGRGDPGSQHAMLGAVYKRPAEMPVAAWSYYFRVADIDAAVTAIKAGGGTLYADPIEIPGGEFSLNAADPQGASFGLVGARK